jgi:hypothetical protein
VEPSSCSFIPTATSRTYFVRHPTARVRSTTETANDEAKRIHWRRNYVPPANRVDISFELEIDPIEEDSSSRPGARELQYVARDHRGAVGSSALSTRERTTLPDAPMLSVRSIDLGRAELPIRAERNPQASSKVKLNSACGVSDPQAVPKYRNIVGPAQAAIVLKCKNI